MSTMAKKVVQITIIPTLADSETLMIRDAMQHVLDFFELLHDENNEHLAWELTGANFSSPFVVEGRPVNTQTGAEAYAMVKHALQGIADIMGDISSEQHQLINLYVKKLRRLQGCLFAIYSGFTNFV